MSTSKKNNLNEKFFNFFEKMFEIFLGKVSREGRGNFFSVPVDAAMA